MVIISPFSVLGALSPQKRKELQRKTWEHQCLASDLRASGDCCYESPLLGEDDYDPFEQT